MTENEARKIFDEMALTTSDDTYQMVNDSNQLSQREALRTLLQHPELLDPLLFVLFADNADVSDLVSYEEYVLIMKEKGKKSKNQGLYKLACAALFMNNQIEKSMDGSRSL